MAILYSFDALGTRFWIEIFDELSPATEQAVTAASQMLVHQFEARYSRFKADSLISQLNLTGTIHNPDEDFLNLLSYGLTLYERSAGIFNVLVGETLIARGYDADYSFTAKPEPASIPNPLQCLSITPTSINLACGQVDIGGFGKGYVIDLLAHLLCDDFKLDYFLINGGGDMFGTSNHGAPITIYLEHPTEENSYLDTTTLYHQGFAASSPHKRTWKSDTKTYTHIVTNQNQPLVADATFVKAHTAADADAFATVALLIEGEQFTPLATAARLGVARYTTRDATFIHNEAFITDR
jgi:FAD:protein FMN transferase